MALRKHSTKLTKETIESTSNKRKRIADKEIIVVKCEREEK